MKEKLVVTKKGCTALWESGGGTANSGESQIIAGRSGEDLVPVYLMRPKKARPNGEHALFVVYSGYYVIRTQRTQQDSYITHIYKVGYIDRSDFSCILNPAGTYGNGVWDQDGDLLVAAKPKILEAVTVSINKCREFNCRRAMYYHLNEEAQR